MRKLIIMLSMVAFGSGHAQVIQLDEARVINPIKVSTTGESTKFVVLEEYSGQFIKNAVGFMKKNLDIQLFIEQMNSEYHVLRVEFKNNKGLLIADFNRKGELLGTTQRFRNIPLPRSVARELAMNYNGWSIARNKYIASGQGEALDKEFYIVTMVNGKNSKKVKIIPNRSSLELAGN